MRGGRSSAVSAACTPAMARAADHVDGADPGMGVRCAHEACVQRAGYQDVIDETTAPGEQRRIFEARDAGAEMVRAHGRCPRTAQRGRNDTPAAWHCNRDKIVLCQLCIPSAVAGAKRGRGRRHLPMSSVVWLWRPVPASAGTVLMPEIVSRRGLSDARRERRSAPIRTTAGGAAAGFPGAPRRARSAGPARADRPGDQQGHRAAPFGAVAVPGRTRGRSAPRVPVHQRHGFVGPAL